MTKNIRSREIIQAKSRHQCKTEYSCGRDLAELIHTIVIKVGSPRFHEKSAFLTSYVMVGDLYSVEVRSVI